MRLTLSALKRIIKEELYNNRRSLREAAAGPSPSEVIAMYKSQPERWNMAYNDFLNMAEGDTNYGTRDYYPGWSDADFQAVLDALGPPGSNGGGRRFMY
jgi:hypothetical protein